MIKQMKVLPSGPILFPLTFDWFYKAKWHHLEPVHIIFNSISLANESLMKSSALKKKKPTTFLAHS